MLSSISEKDQRTLRMGAIGAGLIILYMAVISPLQDRLAKVRDDVAKSQKTLSSIQTQMIERVKAKEAADTLATRAIIYRDRTSLNRQTAAMLDQIEKLPSYHLLSVRRLEGLPLRDEDDYYHSSVSLQFTSTLGNFHQFLKEMESAEPSLRVDRMSLTADAKDRSLVEGQMVISAFAVVAQKGKSGT